MPYAVREALDLKPPRAQEAESPPGGITGADSPLSPLGKAIIGLSGRAEGLPAKDELFEFTARLVRSAQEAGLLKPEGLPRAFR